ncbi:MAG TPA: PVC-type heme-binding CxxCH protein [Planctomycetaceae bacterium]|jgi:putative membrane-bound dehydrogenase-like protein
MIRHANVCCQTRPAGGLAVFMGILLAIGAGISAAQKTTGPASQNHANVMVYRDEAGREHPVNSPADWLKRRAHIVAGMEQAMGPLPDLSKLPPLDVRIDESKTYNGEGYTRLTLSYAAEAGDRVPAYLYLPSNRPKDEGLPAMLALHPTGPQGKGIVDDAGPRPNRGYGKELAQRGYVVLAPDYPSFGDYQYDFKAGKYVSGTMKGILNHIRGVDLLQSRPEVDSKRIGAIGHSLGGHNAMFVGVFDERLKVIVSSCGWTPFHDYYGGKIAGWTSDRYMPRLKDVYMLDAGQIPFDFYEVVAALAPRAFFSVSPERDSNFDVAGVRKAEPEGRKVFNLFGAGKNFEVRYPDCEHDFPEDMRKAAYSFADQVLKHKSLDVNDFADELPRIPPHEPADALTTFKTLPGFRMEQAAAEPLLHSPVAIDFDENGRMFVCEMIDYSEQDKEYLGAVRVLEDSDGDGRFEKSTLLADKLSWPTALCCYDGGVFVGAAPDIYYLKDTDDDGKADVRRTVFTGFGRSNVQGLFNSFHWGLDNRIHGATSSSGAQVRRPDAADTKPIVLSGRDFAFDPRTLEIQPTSGGAQHGMSFDDWGRKFLTSNSDHIQLVMYEDRYLARNPFLASPGSRMSIAADGPQAEVFRISPVEPWRIVRTRLRVSGKVPGPVEGGGRAAGYFTGATGVTIYRGDAWPAEFRGQAFVGDVGSNIVHRKRLEPDGVGLIARRADENKEFVASTDIWFRPAQFANAPDGNLYVIDVYREVIEHPASLPPAIKQHLDLTNGRDRGRIYRVIHDGFRQQKIPQLGQATIAELVATLAHRNGWHRDTAARLLFERADRSDIAPLVKLATASPLPEGRMHALYTLASLGGLTSEVILPRLADEHPRVREHAVRLSENLADDSAEIQRQYIVLADDSDLRVRYQLAFSAGVLPGVVRTAVLTKILTCDGGDRWVRLAALSSLAEGAGDVLRALSVDVAFSASGAGRTVFVELASLIGRQARAFPAAVIDVAHFIEAFSAERKPLALAMVASLHEGLSKSGLPPNERALLVGKPGRVREFLAELLDTSRKAAVDELHNPVERIAAIRRLGLAPFAENSKILPDLLGTRQPQEVQLAAVDVLARYSDPQIGSVLTEAWPTFGPKLRTAVMEAVFSRGDWLLKFLEAVEKNEIPVSDLEPGRVRLLDAHSNPAVREKAAGILEKLKIGRRQDVFNAYKPALTLTGDAARGKIHFQKVCAACHRLDNFGTELGPNLATVQNRGAEAILLNMLDPNREVNPQFVNYVLVTNEGRAITGLIVAETTTSVTLKRQESASEIVLRADIEELRSTGQSIMPEGIENQLDHQAVADLIAYLVSVK